MRKSLETTAKLLTMLTALVLLLASFTLSVSAAGEEPKGPRKEDPDTKAKLYKEAEESDDDSSGTGVHKDPTVFEKNFCLTPAQKEQTINTIETAISEYLTNDMSDLEKYYMLALWENYSVRYDSEFWPGGYDFDYYKHQWDAFGVLEEHLAVCAGIAVTYANLCHAAGLPCKFVRCNPDYLDHTINHIPDINGNSYYIDVTENTFFMSKDADWSFEPIDLKFSGISEGDRPSDGSFEYNYNDQILPSNIKDFYSGKIGEGSFKPKPFEVWFNEYALHKNSSKDFRTPYVEKGSGNGAYHANYSDFDKYPAQPYASRPNTENVTGIWFLDDFYLEPTKIKEKIENKEFDEELLIISGMADNYDCTGESLEKVLANLEADIKEEFNQNIISVQYFPTLSEDGKIVSEADDLTNNTDYEVEYVDYDDETHEAIFAIKGIGEYSGEGQANESLFRVKVNSALVTKTPIRSRNLEYNGKPQNLLAKKGEAINGEMVYGIGTKDNPPLPEVFSSEIPTATNAGSYYIWYKAKGDESHHDSEPQLIRQPVGIEPISIWIYAQDVTIRVGETKKLNPIAGTDLETIFTFVSGDEDVVRVSEDGTLKGVAKGVTAVTISARLKDSDSNNYEFVTENITVKVTAGDPAKADKAKLSFDPSGGTWEEGGTDIKVFEAEQGTEFRIIDAPKRDGYTFEYWEGSEYLPGQKFKVDGDHTFTAKWRKNNSNIKGKSVKTGDASNPIIWILMMLASGGVAAGIITRKKRREQND